MAITTSSNVDVVRQQVYSDFVLRTLSEKAPSDLFVRNVSDFGDGDTLNIPTIGTATIQDVTEDEALSYNPIESGRISLTITDYVGDAYYATRPMQQDAYAFNALLSARAEETGIAMANYYASRLFNIVEAAQTDSDPNTINGQAHRRAGSGTNNVVAIEDFARMKVAFDKANISSEGRVAFVDPTVSYELNRLSQTTFPVNSNPLHDSILKEGISSGMNYVTNLFGWTIMESNLLPKLAAGTDVDGTTTITNASVANLFMSVASDQLKPVMAAWRQQPMTDFEFNKDRQRDEWVTTGRFGIGIQREDSIGVLVTDETRV